ncbi:hypothetical protein EV182_000886 [Spiromyces aspiralis]|uniref:Uncharacterized protein n=1 Tax=Spiromyces aspiralis TaxID=68401 RepID=A0ACC1HIS3_9FUNG|nr:hypothetical protein EV182_000886 [Spiromyces aspiralis]
MGPTSPSIPASFAVTSDSRFADGFQFLRDRLGTNPTKVVDDGYTFLLRENPSSSYSSSSAANPTLTRTPNSVTYPPTAGGISPQRESPGTRITADGNDKPVEGGQRRDTVIKAEQQNPITKPATRPQRSLKDILDKLHSTKPKFRTLSSIGSSTYSELVKQASEGRHFLPFGDVVRASSGGILYRINAVGLNAIHDA